MKKIISLIAILLIMIIGIHAKDNKISYVSLGDGLSLGINENNYVSKGYSDYIKEYLELNKKLKFYTKEFSKQDARIIDIINDINDNVTKNINNKEITIQNVLKKANIITISLGFNELLYKYSNDNMSYTYNYIDSYINDMEKLINLIKEYNNKTIFILGYYNPTDNKELDKYVIYANDKLINLCDKEKVNYMDLYSIFDNNKKMINYVNNLYPNSEGYKLISNKIIKKISNIVNKS